MRFSARLAVTLLLSTTWLIAEPTPTPKPTTPAAEDADDQIVAPTDPVAPKPDPAAERYWQALKLLRDGKATDWPQARAWLKESADAEFTHAQNFVGLCLLNGQHGYKKDVRQAANLFRLAAGRGNAFAKLNLGLCYLNGVGVSQDRAQAREWFTATVAPDADFSAPTPPDDFYQTAQGTGATAPMTLSSATTSTPAERARAEAHSYLGDLCARDKQTAEAQRHYVQAATMGEGGRAGLYGAALNAALNYAFGRGTDRDMRKADEFLTKSKNLLRHHGISYAHSLVTEKLLDDFAQSDLEEDIDQATDKLQEQIQFEIAGSFADPKAKTYDAREAVKWYEVAAEGDNAWAMLSLAFLYHDGRLGQPDPVKAFAWFKQAAERGNHYLGWANLATCYEHGLGTPRDHAKAAEIWAKNRDGDIVCYLGSIGQCPAAILTFEQALELNKTWAKQHKDPQAQYLLGQRYRHGWGVKEDVYEAINWYQKAAKSQHAPALYALGGLYYNYGIIMGCRTDQKAKSQAFSMYQAAAERGEADAFFSLAYMYNDGEGTTQDQAKAIELYRKAIELKPRSSGAHNNLGTIYKGMATRQEPPHLHEEHIRLMLFHFREADKLKDAYAAWNLGLLAYEGTLQPKDLQAAYSYFDQAASRGHPSAHFKLATMLEQGEGVPISYREAAYHYRLAALEGNVEALQRLCELYISDNNLIQDWDRALYWLTLLANKGYKGAIVYIGEAFLRKGDYASGLSLYKSMRDSDDQLLQGFGYERLSRLYANGWGVKANPKKAQKYQAKALALGNREALFNQAKILIQAAKVPEAIPLLEKAAEAGLAEADYTLGGIYTRGQGVAKDPTAAWDHMLKAAKRGNTNAMISLALSTVRRVPGAPSLEMSLKLAEKADACGNPKAKKILEQLEALQTTSETPPPAETGVARPI